MSTGSPASHSLRLWIHAPTPTRFAAGLTLRSPNFFPPSHGACSQANFEEVPRPCYVGVALTFFTLKTNQFENKAQSSAILFVAQYLERHHKKTILTLNTLRSTKTVTSNPVVFTREEPSGTTASKLSWMTNSALQSDTCMINFELKLDYKKCNAEAIASVTVIMFV